MQSYAKLKIPHNFVTLLQVIAAKCGSKSDCFLYDFISHIHSLVKYLLPILLLYNVVQLIEIYRHLLAHSFPSQHFN